MKNHLLYFITAVCLTGCGESVKSPKPVHTKPKNQSTITPIKLESKPQPAGNNPLNDLDSTASSHLTDTTEYSPGAKKPYDCLLYGTISQEGSTSLENAKISLAVIDDDFMVKSFSSLKKVPYSQHSLPKNGKIKLPVNSDQNYVITITGDHITTISSYLFELKKVKSQTSRFKFQKDISTQLPQTTNLEGTLTDPNGEPIADSPVYFTPIVKNKFDFSLGQDLVTTTNISGKFHLINLPALTGDVYAYPKGYAPVFATDINLPTDKPLNLKAVAKGGNVSVKVINSETMQPVQNAKVALRERSKDDRRHSYDLAGQRFASTDANGSALFEDLTPGEYGYAASSSSPQLWLKNDNHPDDNTITVTEGETLPLELNLFSGNTITGKVFDKESNAPLPGALITFNLSNLDEKVTTSGENGVYKISGIYGFTNVTVTLKGYYTEEPHLKTIASSPDSSELSFDIPMVQTLKISGQTVTENGTPISGATVISMQSLDPQYANGIKSSADGAFTVETRPFTPVVLWANSEGLVPKELMMIDTKLEDISGINFVLYPEIQLAGIVTDKSGNPIPGVSIMLDRGENYRTQNSDYGNFSDHSGRYEISGLTPTSSLKLTKTGYSPKNISLSELGLKHGDKKQDFNIVMESGLSISGTLKTKSGAPPKSNIHVMIKNSEGKDPGSLAIYQNSFIIKDLPPGEYTVESFMGDFPTQKVMAGTTDLEIIVNDDIKPEEIPEIKYAAVSGKVFDKITKAPIENYNVKGYISFLPISKAPKNPSQFKINKVQSDFTHTFTIVADGYAPTSFEVSIPKDAEKIEQDFPISRGSSVKGILVDKHTRQPIANAVIDHNTAYINSDNPPLSPQSDVYTVTDAGGKFELHGIPEQLKNQENIIVVRPSPPYRVKNINPELRVGETTDLGEIPLADGGTVKGVLSDTNGAPMANQTITIKKSHSRDSASDQSTQANENGNFEFKGLADGSYKIACESAEAEASIFIEDQGDTTVNLKVGEKTP